MYIYIKGLVLEGWPSNFWGQLGSRQMYTGMWNPSVASKGLGTGRPASCGGRNSHSLSGKILQIGIRNKKQTIWSYCWWFRTPAPVEVGSLSHYLQEILHPRWLFRSSSINHFLSISFCGQLPCAVFRQQCSVEVAGFKPMESCQDEPNERKKYVEQPKGISIKWRSPTIFKTDVFFLGDENPILK